MKKQWMKIALPILVLGVGFAGMSLIKVSADQDDEKKELDTRPTVRVESVVSQNYPVVITSYGEVEPFESTMLAAQVSGEVVSWNENFVPGGLIRRGEVMFSIEKDAYEAALLQAEANLSQAESALIEEKARAEVAKREAKTIAKSKVTDLYLRKPQVLSAKASVKSAQAQLKIARRDLANTQVRAPYDALVISRNIGLGQFVNQGASVAQLNNIETAEVTVPVAGFDQAFLPNNLAGQEVTVRTRDYDGISRSAYIARDLGVVDSSTRMSQLVMRIQDPYGMQSKQTQLKFGTYVEVSFRGKTLNNIYRLPQELVTNRTVWVVDGETKLKPKQVEVVREEGAYMLVGSGLSDRDRVVMTLPEYPQKGMEVKIADESSDVNEADGDTLMAQTVQ